MKAWNMIDDRLHCSVGSHHNSPYQNNRKPQFSIYVHHERGLQIYFIQVYRFFSAYLNTSIMMWGTCNGQHMMDIKRERERMRECRAQMLKNWSHQVITKGCKEVTLTSGIKKLIIRAVNRFLGDVLHAPVRSALLA